MSSCIVFSRFLARCSPREAPLRFRPRPTPAAALLLSPLGSTPAADGDESEWEGEERSEWEEGPEEEVDPWRDKAWE